MFSTLFLRWSASWFAARLVPTDSNSRMMRPDTADARALFQVRCRRPIAPRAVGVPLVAERFATRVRDVDVATLPAAIWTNRLQSRTCSSTWMRLSPSRRNTATTAMTTWAIPSSGNAKISRRSSPIRTRIRRRSCIWSSRSLRRRPSKRPRS